MTRLIWQYRLFSEVTRIVEWIIIGIRNQYRDTIGKIIWLFFFLPRNLFVSINICLGTWYVQQLTLLTWDFVCIRCTITCMITWFVARYIIYYINYMWLKMINHSMVHKWHDILDTVKELQVFDRCVHRLVLTWLLILDSWNWTCVCIRGGYAMIF